MFTEEYEGGRPDEVGALAVALLACCTQDPALITRAAVATPLAPADRSPAPPTLSSAAETLSAA